LIYTQPKRALAPPDEFDRFIEHWRPFMDRDRGDKFFISVEFGENDGRSRFLYAPYAMTRMGPANPIPWKRGCNRCVATSLIEPFVTKRVAKLPVPYSIEQPWARNAGYAHQEHAVGRDKQSAYPAKSVINAAILGSLNRRRGQRMRIQRLSLRDGAAAARGTTVIIDVYRAFTCEPLMYYLGASHVLLEAHIDRCLSFRGQYLLVGENNELPIDGFDLTNSPSLILAKGRGFFTGRTVLHRTTSGVTGAAIALPHADEVLLASFANASATAYYIRQRHPELVSIVAMGIRSERPAPEDEWCGAYIESLLCGKPYDHVEAMRQILNHESAQKFLRGDKPYLPKEDAAICIQRDLFDFALRAEPHNDLILARKVTV
jgi:2-phosphosulfolactate phosphatase